MACNKNVILTPCVYRDTWEGLSEVSFTSDGNAFVSPLESVRMFFKNEDGDIGLSLTSANGDITITDADNWEFDVNQVTPMPLAVGNWYWSIETTDSQGIIKTRIAGTIEIYDDATQ